MKNFKTKAKKVKSTVLMLLGVVLISATISWTSIAVPAWLTKIIATKEYSGRYQLVNVSKRGTGWKLRHLLELKDIELNEHVLLPISTQEYNKNNLKIGETVIRAPNSSAK